MFFGANVAFSFQVKRSERADMPASVGSAKQVGQSYQSAEIDRRSLDSFEYLQYESFAVACHESIADS
jgi:hypothetical protein